MAVNIGAITVEDILAANQRQIWEIYAQVYHLLRNLRTYRDMIGDCVTRAGLTSDDVVLDLACGDGGLAWWLQKYSKERPAIIGVDSSWTMIAQAKAEPYDGDAQFFYADLSKPADWWEIPPGPYTCIFCNNFLYTLEDPSGFLAGAATLAVSGARWVGSTPIGPPTPEAVAAVLGEHLVKTKLEEGIDPEQERPRVLELLKLVVACNQRILELYGDAGLYPGSAGNFLDWYADTPWSPGKVGTTYAGLNFIVAATLQPEPAREG